MIAKQKNVHVQTKCKQAHLSTPIFRFTSFL